MNKIKQQIEYWKISAGRNWKTALGLFELKHYDSCLFFCHLTIEKMLKGLVVQKTKNLAPYIHHLEKLAELAELKITDEQRKNLRIITRFNVSGRYDDAKHNFYKIVNKLYAEKYLKISKDLILWLKKQYQKN
ncbi:HEPN domain-containing protein [Patescibacteria group bacterium]|nr:HEPN domain-containing protein [Patescibacteria group bacterium]MCG2695336.1 HEPN domain-containing protein [Candidatus Parcubacteria bacterium]MCG2701186.1 HEPN domain-containing protein [Candidatus Parcubacteria bacterium]